MYWKESLGVIASIKNHNIEYVSSHHLNEPIKLVRQSSFKTTVSKLQNYIGYLLVFKCISHHIQDTAWDEITYPFPNVNGGTVEVWEWINHLMLGLKLNHFSERGPKWFGTSHFTHIPQGDFTGTEKNVYLPSCQWSKPNTGKQFILSHPSNLRIPYVNNVQSVPWHYFNGGKPQI